MMIDCVTLGRCCIFSLTSCVQAANNNDLGLHLERKPLRKKKKKERYLKEGQKKIRLKKAAATLHR